MNVRFVILCFLVLLPTFYSFTFQRVLRPNLSAGEYKLKFKAAFTCDETANYSIDLRLHLHRASETRTELRGNMTLKVPFDDSLFLNVNMAVLSKIGGWKDNAYVYRSGNACTTLKFFIGPSWLNYMSNMDLREAQQCPIPKLCILQGQYVFRGYDLSEVKKWRLPKDFFYGTYKFRLYYSDKKGITIGCVVLVVDVLRPWEDNVGDTY